jgi:Calcineurin-like phosphoesterase
MSNQTSSPGRNTPSALRPLLSILLGISLALGVFDARLPAHGQVAEKTKRPARDWAVNPPIVEVDTTADIFAMGDVHGDYDRLVKLLLRGKIIEGIPTAPGQARWAAGKSVLICTGDMIDKGHNSIEVILLFKALQADAPSAGGRVIVTMGNHEAEFLADPVCDPKAVEFLEDLARQRLDARQVADGLDGLGIGAFLRSLPFAARVNDWFFAHAGNSQGMTLEQLGSSLRDGVNAREYAADVLLADNSLLEARLHPHPWWEDATATPKENRARLRHGIEALGVKHLVIGHQPGKVEFSGGTKRKKGEIYQNFDGLIFLIDVGMSNCPELDDSEGALLHIHGGDPARATALFPDGTKRRLWPEE